MRKTSNFPLTFLLFLLLLSGCIRPFGGSSITPLPSVVNPTYTSQINPTELVKSPVVSPEPVLTITETSTPEIIYQQITAENCSPLQEIGQITNISESFSISPDSRYLASGSLERNVHIHDLQTLARIQVLEQVDYPGHIWSLDFSPDGSMLAAGTGNGDIYLWIQQNEVFDLLTIIEAHSADVRSLDFSPDGTHLVSGSNDQTIKIWDLGTFELEKTLVWNPGYVHTIQYSPDGNFIASGSWFGNVRLWNGLNGNFKGEYTLHNDQITKVSFSPDETLLMISALNPYLFFFSTDPFARILIEEAHEDDILCSAFSSDGALVVTGSKDASIKIWKAPSIDQTSPLELLHSIEVDENVILTDIQFSPDQKLLIASSRNSSIHIWAVQ